MARTQRTDTAGVHQPSKSTSSVRPGVNLYKSAISTIGRSAAKKQTTIFDYETFNANRRSRRGQSSTSSKPALISEKEYEVSDGWMIDDLGGRYIRPDPCDSKKRTRVQGSRDSSPLLSDDDRLSDGNSDCPMTVNVDDCFDPEIPEVGEPAARQLPRTSRNSDDDLVLLSERPARRKSPKRPRLRQSRLVTVTTPSPTPTTSDDVVFAGYDDAPIAEVVQPARNVTAVPPSAYPPADFQSIRPSSEIVRVNVVVDGRKFAVIVDNRYVYFAFLNFV